ncbi:hypothetical protein JTE90_008766 [Oedothorax gibbosus]|uniref:Uncharacterized protein n=1 Tax=Oedothorax gibbosus TaxID=931172 RepID=A0AAV6TE76_9ARAC|nr:hypothetical protein JTE90_008766 [Oedothorax gibbosus]
MGSHERLASDPFKPGAFGSSHSASSAYQSGPLGTLILSRPAFSHAGGLLTHLKFENRLRSFWAPKGL